ncbi:MAG: galactokinase, partial [Oscillospiraceae bacterium]|nr:galactokinase [Oscillospiraceae bacterium]
EAAALARGDFAEFLGIVNRSGLSSIENLQNIFSPAHPENQAVGLAISLGRELLEGTGAIRVHGGGFAGTVQAFVPNERLEAFRSGIEAVFGRGKCHVLHIRPVGGCALRP